MQNSYVIGLVGAIGSGKSTVADILSCRHGYVRVRMADALKNMLRVIGLTDDHLDGKLKEVPTDLLNGRTPRWAMQALGTEWGRKCINPNFWVTTTEAKIAELLERGERVVVDDIRFTNEVAMVRRLEGTMYRVIRFADLVTDNNLHESEQNWSSLSVDGIVCNRSDIDNLTQQINQIFEITLVQE